MNYSRRAALMLIGIVIAAALVVPALPTQAQGAVFVGAGDIASCGSEGDELTAAIIEKIDGLVFTAGDTVQGEGTAQFWQECYEPSWGRFKDRTRPALGNHEYQGVKKPDAYFDFFGEAAGPRDLGYYSYGYGAWHIIVLNSILPAHAGTAQYKWLEADLAANPVPCTLAIFHHPVFSSGAGGVTRRMNAAFKLLYKYGADVVISGDAHHYERFAPQDPQGRKDTDHGIRQFVVGTGGGYLTKFGKVWRNSEVRQNEAWGVLKLALDGGGYSWEFIPVEGRTFTDSGSAPCVGPAEAS